MQRKLSLHEDIPGRSPARNLSTDGLAGLRVPEEPRVAQTRVAVVVSRLEITYAISVHQRRVQQAARRRINAVMASRDPRHLNDLFPAQRRCSRTGWQRQPGIRERR